MADKKNNEEFTVADRRRFSFEDGEVHDNPDHVETAEQEQKAAPPASVAEEPKRAEVREFPKRDTAPAPPASETPKAEGEQQPPVSAEERKAGDAAFAESTKKIDEQIRSQLGRQTEEFQMTFERFVASIYMTALMQLGLVHEQGGQPRVDLLGARQTIDSLALLREKTKGNLTPTEENLMNNSLYEVQMAYVEVTNALTRQVKPAPPSAIPNPFTKK